MLVIFSIKYKHIKFRLKLPSVKKDHSITLFTTDKIETMTADIK